MYRKLFLSLFLSGLLWIGLTRLVGAAPLVPSGRDPALLPDGLLCQSIPGGVKNMEEVSSEGAGPTYYNSIPGHRDFISSTITITPPFNLSLWDPDGERPTVITLTNQGVTADVFNFSGPDNAWSGWVTITKEVDGIQVLPPLTHKSTSLCFRPGVRQPMIDLTVIGHLDGAPTGLPVEDEIVAPASYYTPTVATGSLVTLTFDIYNTGSVTATGVEMSMGGIVGDAVSLPKLTNYLPIGALAPGDHYPVTTNVRVASGLNVYIAEITMASPDDVDSTPNNHVFEEDDMIVVRFFGQDFPFYIYLPLSRR